MIFREVPDLRIDKISWLDPGKEAGQDRVVAVQHLCRNCSRYLTGSEGGATSA
jgi:hypothetical protein